jgi:hypothetical protein
MKLARVLSSLSLAASAIAGPFAYSQANVVENQTTILYVDAQSGSDANSGVSSAPLKTIQAAVNKANTNNQKSIGTKIIVNSGTYRETVNVDPVTAQTPVPLTIQAATSGAAIISASDVLTAWSPDPQYSGAYVANWTPAQSTCALPSGWPSVRPIALHTEMLFVNSIPMTQVLAYTDLKPGTFFVDTSAGTVHLWPPSGVTPSTATTEVATRTKTISIIGRTNIVLRGLVFQHAANCINTSGATVTSSNNVLIDSIQANWNNFGGLGISSSTNVTVQNSIASYNGGVGFQGTKGQATLYTNNETDYNNWRGAQAAFYDWASGGAKFFEMRTTTVQNHFSYNNQAQGLWFDTDNQNITIDNATLVGSYNAALQIERNKGPITLQNSHLCSSGTGVNVLTTEGLSVKNNVFYNNGATNKYQAQFYLAGTAGGINIIDWQTGQVYDLFTTGTSISGNTFLDAQSGQYVFGTYLSGTDWTDFTSTVKSDNNTWYDANTSNAFHIVNGKSVNLPGWQTATGQDYNSSWAAPATTPASVCAVPSASYADFNVSLDSGSYTMSSGRATATVRVNSFNFGTVNLSVSGLPAGVTASFSVPNLTSGFSILTFTASSATTTRTVPVTLWAISGDRVHNATFNLTVNANSAVIGTTTSLSSSASSVAENSPVTLTAKVQQTSGTTTPTGSVTFYNGSTSIGTTTLSSGTAALSTSALSVGVNSITASYAGNSTFNASTSSPVTVSVNASTIATSTTLAASSSSIAQNSPVTLTATVKPASGTTSPTGTITFYNASVALGSASLSGGSANLSTSSLPVGTDSITAVYSGSNSYNSSTSNAVAVSVNQAVTGTATKLASSATTITQNSPVTLSATVTQTSGSTTPTGTVTFYNGTTSLGSASVSSGIATLTTSTLPTGTDSVSAAYSGAVAFRASSSNLVAITVNAPAPTAVNTTTTLAASPTSITQGATVTFTAVVKPASGPTTPTGTVTFYNGGTAIGSASLSAGTASFSTTSLPAGQQSITATYGGSAAFRSSTSSPLNVAITAQSNPTGMSTSTTLTSSTSQADRGFTIALTATTSAAGGAKTPTGNILFYVANQQIGTATLSGGRAYLKTASLPAGDDVITASYSGNSEFAPSTSKPITIKIMGPDFTVLATPSTVTLSPGSSAVVALLITPMNGFNDTPLLSCSGLPSGSSCSFGTMAKEADGTAVVDMTIRTPPLSADSQAPRVPRRPFVLAFLPLLLWISSKRRKQLRGFLTLPAILAALLLLGGGTIGCAGKASFSSTQTAAPAAISVVVTARTNTGISHTTTVALNLK